MQLARFRLLLPVAIAVAGAGLAVLLSTSLSGYVVFLALTAVVAIISLLGLGIISGTAGMIALCQLTFAAIGAWVVSLLNRLEAPGGFVAWMIAGTLSAALAGILIGLPALRLRGVNLAVVTLGFAAAAHALLLQIQFPGAVNGISIQRPAGFTSDRGYLLFACLVLILCALGVWALQRSRWGWSWRAVAFSERGAAAVGQSVRLAKLSAFAVSAALGGVSGSLLAGQVQLPFASAFTPIQSLALYVLTIMSGAHLIDMAIFGGILWVLVPEILRRIGVPQDWGLVIFGVLGVQAITSGSSLGEVIRRRLRRRPAPVVREETPVLPAMSIAPRAEGSALEVEDLRVQFGSLRALDGVSLSVDRGSITGLIGPNGAGKSTFVDAISGFLPQGTGRISLDGIPLGTMDPVRRARAGLRRTFQQQRVPPTLTVGAYVQFVARRSVSPTELAAWLRAFDVPGAATPLSLVDVAARRVVEVVANALARPKVLVLDEPAAGLPHEEHLRLAALLQQIPERTGASLVLIEHDLDLVRSVCDRLTVLDFGSVLMSGPTAQVLGDPAVATAYMGDVQS